jgi:hypothetical protein
MTGPSAVVAGSNNHDTDNDNDDDCCWGKRILPIITERDAVRLKSPWSPTYTCSAALERPVGPAHL